MLKKFEIGLLVISVLLIAVAVSGCVASPVKVVVNYPGSWNGTITTEKETRTIEGTGEETIDLGTYVGSLKVDVEKKDKDSNETLSIQLMRGDEIVNSANSSVSGGGELEDAILSVHITA
ncbi:MAG: hypothetical protein ABFC12_08065 [Methanobacterium sp.]